MSTTIADPTGQAGLQYFGRATAAISHELKNALAIIDENAGLMNDCLLMADRQPPVDPATLKEATARIARQVQRADGIIDNMNRLAHSVDEPVKSIDLHEIVNLSVKLSRREASMRQVSISVIPASATATVRTSPFLLLALIGRCLSYALGAMTPGQMLSLRISQSEDGGRIDFEPQPRLSSRPAESFLQADETALLASLKATFSTDDAAGRISVKLSNC